MCGLVLWVLRVGWSEICGSVCFVGALRHEEIGAELGLFRVCVSCLCMRVGGQGGGMAMAVCWHLGCSGV